MKETIKNQRASPRTTLNDLGVCPAEGSASMQGVDEIVMFPATRYKQVLWSHASRQLWPIVD
jgi:hypothetical protein